MIRQICEVRIRTLVASNTLEQDGTSFDDLIERIAKIVSQNLISSRLKRVVDKSEDNISPVHNSYSNDEQIKYDGQLQGISVQSLIPYIDRVANFYLREHERVERLGTGDEAEWKKLHDQLTTRAYYALLRRQISATRARDEAMEFSQETCHAIFSNLFPYDVPFDAWIAKILNNFILQRYSRSRDLIDRKPQAIISLDYSGHQTKTVDEFSFHNLLSDERSVSAFNQVEVQEWLIQAIAGLRSQAQQQVIIYTFFYDLTDEEIADRITKSKNAVQILRHRALQRLQKILAQEMKEYAIRMH